MSSDAYQVYHFMTHRAIAICSAVKQDQFRAMTEMTVNQLMDAAQAQALEMHEALKNQRRLNEIGIESINQFKQNHNTIKESQTESLGRLQQSSQVIEENLVNLQMELKLRQQSEETLNEIGKSTVEISLELEKQAMELHNEHEKIMKDVDEISSSLQKNNMQLLEQYNQTLEFLHQFQSVLLVLSNIATNIKSYVDKILTTMHDVGFELSDEFVACMMLNIIYFTCGMIFLMFLSAFGPSKLILIALFVFNSITAYYKAEVALLPLNIFVWISFSGEKVFHQCLCMFKTT